MSHSIQICGVQDIFSYNTSLKNDNSCSTYITTISNYNLENCFVNEKIKGIEQMPAQPL